MIPGLNPDVHMLLKDYLPGSDLSRLSQTSRNAMNVLHQTAVRKYVLEKPGEEKWDGLLEVCAVRSLPEDFLLDLTARVDQQVGHQSAAPKYEFSESTIHNAFWGRPKLFARLTGWHFVYPPHIYQRWLSDLLMAGAFDFLDSLISEGFSDGPPNYYQVIKSPEYDQYPFESLKWLQMRSNTEFGRYLAAYLLRGAPAAVIEQALRMGPELHFVFEFLPWPKNKEVIELFPAIAQEACASAALLRPLAKWASYRPERLRRERFQYVAPEISYFLRANVPPTEEITRLFLVLYGAVVSMSREERNLLADIEAYLLRADMLPLPHQTTQ